MVVDSDSRDIDAAVANMLVTTVKIGVESSLHLFVAFLAGLLVSFCEADTGCCLEAALMAAPVQNDLLGSFLAAVLLFRWPIISNNLFYYECIALGYAYCFACVILIIVHALFL